MGGVGGVGGSNQAYTSGVDYIKDKGIQATNTALTTAISGGSWEDAAAEMLKTELKASLANLGVAGKIVGFVMDLWLDRKGEANQSKALTGQHGQQGQAALEAQKEQMNTAVMDALSDLTSGGNLMSVQDCKNAITSAVGNIQGKMQEKEQLNKQLEEYRDKQNELAEKIRQHEVSIKESKEDGVEFIDKDGNKIDPKNNDPEKAELYKLIIEYSNNANMITALSETIAKLDIDSIKSRDEVTGKSEELKESTKATQEEIQTSTEDQLKSFRSEISGIYNQFADIIGADEQMHKIYQTTDKVLAGVQSAAAISAAFLDPTKATELARKSANNLIASQFDKIGEQLGLKNLGALATGQVSLQDYALDMAKSGFEEQANQLLSEIIPQDFAQTQHALVSELTKDIKIDNDKK